MPKVTLREVTRETLSDVLELRVGDDQRCFVAENAESIAEAHFSPEAWFRAIYAGDEAVGFVMLADVPKKPKYILWRFMIGASHQGKGYGRAAIELLVDHVRTRPNATELRTSVVEGEGGPRPFYESLGFVSTETYDDGELVLARPLS